MSNQITLDPNSNEGQPFIAQNGIYSLSISDANSSSGCQALYFLTLNDQIGTVKIFVQSPGSYGETVSVHAYGSDFSIGFNQYPIDFDPSVIFTYNFNLTAI
jgi:hypothetical protein